MKKEEAARHYEKIRIASDDIKVISRNTGIEESVIQRVKEHVFYEEHILYDGVRKFDPQADMAVAWKRLTDNEFLQSDLILLQHEYVESLIMRGVRVPYSEAHAMADKIYDWYSFL